MELAPAAAQAVKSLGAVVAKALLRQSMNRAVAGTRKRRLRQGKDSKELESTLRSVLLDGVEDVVTGLFEDPEEQESFRRGLLDQDKSAWPLVNGSFPSDLIAEVRSWTAPLLAEVSEDGIVPAVRADHALVETLAGAVLNRLRHWALRSGGSPVTPMWLEFVEEAKAAEIFDAGKFPPRLDDLRQESLFDALQFKYRVVPYIGSGPYNGFLDDAVDWVRSGEDRPSLEIGVLTGPGGTGKSRLAAEICDRIESAAPHWQVGFADYEALAQAVMPTRPLLLVCDYPERHPERVGDFLEKMRRYQREARLTVPVRVLLVSRHTDTWHEAVKTRFRGLDIFTKLRIRLATGDLSPSELVEHAVKAFDAFCQGFGVPLSDRFSFRPASGGIDRPLMAHVVGLVAAHGVWQGLSDSESMPLIGVGEVRTLLDDLIDIEVRRLGRLRIDGDESRPLVFNSNAEIRQALCVTTLTAPVRRDLPELLSNAESFGSTGRGDPGAVADVLLQAYPTMESAAHPDRFLHSISPVEPDLIAAHLLSTTPGRSELVKRLVTSETIARRPDYHAQLLGTLALAAEDYPDVGRDLKEHLVGSLSFLIGAGEATETSLTGLLSKRLTSLAQAAVAAADDQDLTPARTLATAILLPSLSAVHSIDEAAADAVKLLPCPHAGLVSLGAALASRSLSHHERCGDQSGIAMDWHGLGVWLSDQGRLEEALEASNRAVAIHRDLSENDSERYLPLLASSMHNLAIRLSEAGLHLEALEKARSALAIREELAEIDSARNLPDLAASLDSLSVRLQEADLADEALDPAGKAASIRAKLVEAGEIGHLPDYANSLNNLAIVLSRTGQETESLSIAQEACRLYAELADSNRIMHLLGLAKCTNNLAVKLHESGRLPEAVATAQEARKLYLELAEENRLAHLLGLVTSANNLVELYSKCGNASMTLVAAEEALELFEQLAVHDRSKYRDRIPQAISNIASLLAEQGQIDKALEAIQSAVDLQNELVKNDRIRHLPALAMILNNKAAWLAETGQLPDAVTVMQASNSAFNSIAAAGDTSHIPSQAANAANLGKLLSSVDHFTEALKYRKQAYDLYANFADEDWTTHRHELAINTYHFSLLLVEIEFSPRALPVADHALRLFQELAHENRSGYLSHLAISHWVAAYVRSLLKIDIVNAILHCDTAITLYREILRTGDSILGVNIIIILNTRAELISTLRWQASPYIKRTPPSYDAAS